MIYLIGGAPRTGKTILGQRLAAKISASWISTDSLHQLLRVKVNDGPRWSKFIQREAARCNLPFADTGHKFEQRLQEVESWLLD